MFSHLFKIFSGVQDISAQHMRGFCRSLCSLEAGCQELIQRGVRGPRPARTCLRTGLVLSVFQRNCAATKEEKVEVGGGIRINYLKVGQGPKNLLFIPGALGTIWTDYKPQVEGLDKLKYTIVVMEQPGFGRSQPPERNFSTDMFHRDADWGAKLMQELSFNKYSVLGWSNGGVSAMILAARYPERVDKLVVWGSLSYIGQQDMKLYKYLRNIDNLSSHMKKAYLSFYDKEYFQKSWLSLYKTLNTIYSDHEGNLCRSLLCRIHCPTLIIHGNLDPMIAPEHPHHLKQHISNSRMEDIFETMYKTLATWSFTKSSCT